MAGGLFGRTFALNEKCVVFSLIIMGLVLYTPPTFGSDLGLYVFLFTVFVVSYVSMAWYDHYYDCQLMPFRRGNTGVTAMLKPASRKGKGSALERVRLRTVIYVSHILIFVPLVVYVAYFGRKADPRAFILMTVLGVFTIGYHIIKLVPLLGKKVGMGTLIYLAHITVVGPLLMYVGLSKGRYKEYVTYLLYLVAAAALVFHGNGILTL